MNSSIIIGSLIGVVIAKLFLISKWGEAYTEWAVNVIENSFSKIWNILRGNK